MDPRRMKKLTRFTRAVCARLSGVLPARIVCCAEAVMRSHASVGYRADRMVVIPNGFDVNRFVPDPAAGMRVRTELAVPPDAPVVGVMARFHPDKDHRTFLLAARAVAEAIRGAVFVLAGFGVTSANSVLAGWIDELGLGGRVRLLGVRDDVSAVLSAVDVVVQSSRAEGFPNVLGEAMACEIPVAATDCGESGEIVGQTGRIVAPGDASALAAAMIELLTLPAERRAALGRAARQRVVERYDIRTVARRFEALWEEVCTARVAAGARAAG
jgi:glycosyltransferase involved in cell wall biosynthesis